MSSHRNDKLFGHHHGGVSGQAKLRSVRADAIAATVNDLGELDAGNSHVQFDEERRA